MGLPVGSGRVLVAVGAVGFLALMRLKLLPAGLDCSPASIPETALSGAAGAYLYGLYDMMTRYKQRDLFPSVVHQLWLAVLVGSVVGTLMSDTFAAFALGAFPLKDLWEWVRTKGPARLQHPATADSGFQLLQGATDVMLDRLTGLGIDSVEALAFTDPVRLLLTTSLEWSLVLDLIDQALLINYVGVKIVDLRAIGIRGSIEAATIDYRLVGGGEITTAERDNAAALVPILAAAIGISDTAVRNLCWQLNNDPLVEFIWSYWSANVPIGPIDSA